MSNNEASPKTDMGVICPGCAIRITVENAGGYRTYCETCVDAMPPFPEDNHGYYLTGKYPNFEWVRR